MAFFVGTPAVGKPTDIDTTARNPLSHLATDDSGNEYLYLKGVASTVAGSVVTLGVASATALLTVTSTGPVAVAMAATVANTFGWYQVRGWSSTVVAGSNGTIVSGGGYLQCSEASEGLGKVSLGVSAGAGNFIFGMFSYSGQPDTDSVAAGTPGIDLITVFLNRPFATKNY